MRIKAFARGALGAAFVVAIGFFSVFALNITTWLIEQTQGATFQTVLQDSSRTWLSSHGVTIFFAEGKVAGLKVPAFIYNLIPLGFSILIGWAMFRSGRKLSGEKYLGFGWAGSILTYLLVSVIVTSVAITKSIFVVQWQGVFIPVALFAALVVVGSVVGTAMLFEDSEPSELREKIRNFFIGLVDKLPWAIKPLIGPALRAGTGVVAAMSAVSAIMISVLLAVNWIEIIKLYQSLQLTLLGTFTVSTGQLTLMPNLIAFGNAWLTGVGFSVGQGSTVSPLVTELGPLPAIPMLASLPTSSSSLGVLFILVPLLAAFFSTLLVKSHTAELRFNYSSATTAAISLGLSIGLVAALEMWVLVELASGSLGPGRMSLVGANPWIVAGVTFAEVSIASVLAAFFSARPDGADTELIKRISGGKVRK
jgi:hypothetical protein